MLQESKRRADCDSADEASHSFVPGVVRASAAEKGTAPDQLGWALKAIVQGASDKQIHEILM